MRQHQKKTIIGIIARKFDFPGYRFSSAGLAVARQTVERCVARISQLDEQGAAASRIGTDLQRWRRWVRAGLGGVVVEMDRVALCDRAGGVTARSLTAVQK